jgi:NADH dehydrogenase [ubiquinone] 1 alpha subcomplex assembly factor 1
MRTLLALAIMVFQGATTTVTVFDFSDVEQVDTWFITDDGVMGGVSQGTWYPEDDYAVFEGEVSLENNGGFSSVRVEFRPVNLSEFDGIELKVRGDGQLYSFNLRDVHSWNSHRLTVEAPVSEDGEWHTIRVPFDELTPTRFGRVISTAPDLDQSRVRSMSILISDYQEGPFRLEIASIALYAEEELEAM